MKVNNKQMTQPNTIKNVELVKGKFSRSEVAHLVSLLIDQKINFHKIQRLQMWESNHSCKTDELDERIQELQNEKELTSQWLNSKNVQGCNFRIEGTLKIFMEE